jgi:PAS domain S-box-containing protein
MTRPTPIDKAIPLDKFKYIMSRTDTKGTIQYGNDYFFEISGYREEELLGQPHNIIRHPDMPKIIFQLMWDRLKEGKMIYAVVKNMAKDGRYYWVTTKFEIQRNPSTKEITGYLAYRQAAKPKTVEAINVLYHKLLQEEKRGGMAASKQYLLDFLDRRNQTYDEYINETIENNTAFRLFFTAMKKMFGAA